MYRVINIRDDILLVYLITVHLFTKIRTLSRDGKLFKFRWLFLL